MKRFDVWMIIIMLIIATVLFGLLRVVKSEAGRCINEPLSYAAQKWTEANPEHPASGSIHIAGEGWMNFNASGLYPGERDTFNDVGFKLDS